MPGGAIAAVGLVAGVASSQSAKKKAKNAADKSERTAIENVRFLSEQGEKAAAEIGRGGEETIEQIRGLTPELEAIISPILSATRGAYGHVVDSAFDPEIAETGQLTDIIAGRVESGVNKAMAGQSPAVRKEIARLSNIKGRETNKSFAPYRGRMSDIQLGAITDVGGIRGRESLQLADILQNLPAQQANLLMGSAAQATPFVTAAQEGAALGQAAGKTAQTAQLGQILNFAGSQI